MDYKEITVAKVHDLADGEMKQVKAEKTPVLLVRVDGSFYAVGAFCTHYGAPLEKGVLSGDRIICPWHQACFNAQNGDLLEPPALDALPGYEVEVRGEDVILKLPEEDDDGHRVPPMVKCDTGAESRTFIIVGAGAAGNMAAQTLREDGFQGRIVMITYENRGPYDRPNLSKEYLQGKAEEEWMPLRPRDFYQQYDIELMTGVRVTRADISSRTIILDKGEILQYDSLLLATGGEPRSLNVPGAELGNILLLRTFDDSDRIIRACEGASRAVVIGAGFIGMETAFSLLKRKLDVTVVAPASVPFEKNFGKEIGSLFKKLHEDQGIHFRLGEKVASFEGGDNVEAVVLENGDRLETDLVIVGIGVQPATDFIEDLDLDFDGSIRVDKHFCAAENVFAAGDIARFPDWRTGDHIRIEHWRTAEQQGRIAAYNMSGKRVAYESVPFFWTSQAGLNFRYVGYAENWDEILIKGDLAAKKFMAFYVKDKKILAAAGNGYDREMAAIQELMRQKKLPSVEELRKPTVDFWGRL